MSTQKFSELLKTTIKKAHQEKPKQIATLGHLLIHCLKQNFRYNQEDSPLVRVINDVHSAIIECAVAPDNKNRITYSVDRAVASYESFISDRSQQQLLTDNVLWWLLEGDFDYKFRRLCREKCAERGVDIVYLMPEFSDLKVTDLGFGIEINSNWLSDQHELPLLGREGDLTKHLGFLSLAILQRRHYLLEGHLGVGKSSFVRELLRMAAVIWHKGTDTLLRNARFILFSQQDFIYSEEDNRTRLTRLYEYLRGNPQVIPVFDGVEGLLNPALSVQEDFTRLFGSILTTGGRTFVLVCRTGGTLSSNLLGQIGSYTLPPLSPTVTLKIVADRMGQLMAQAAVPLDFQGSEEEFCDLLINLASERYPGRFFPEIALHLAESAVNRAVNRVLYLKEEPLDKIIYEDLWEHVAEEQSLSVEVLGKNPDEFYDRVGANLKLEVIAQDFAVDKVCNILRMMAKRPPRRAPRGRFLFVGPPGVGKTHLGRQLAIHLGLGDEAFFIFNMSEYSSESARTRFMGSDPGYVGYRSTQTIYDLVRSRPSCVILLDEIDRADASIQDILLSILEGEGKDAEGNIVYFSQVIFIMTTNQGQDQVEEAYKNAKANETKREELADEFDDRSLRKLILKGVVDEIEADMRELLLEEINAVKDEFRQWKLVEDASELNDGEEIIDRYIEVQNRYKRLEYAQQKTPLDRAFLDRIDFVIPFFPIKEQKYLEQILNLILGRYRWNNCPDPIKKNIISEALAEDESVRSLERLVMRYLEEFESHGREVI